MDVLVAADTTKEQALSLGRYFREKYGGDFIDITIWDSRDSWALSPLWDKYADEVNAAKVREIEADWAKHCLVKVFYNPLFQGDMFDKISWLADSRDR
jgi:hypothetical protein